MNVLIDSSVWSLGLRRRKRDLNPIELKSYYEWERLLIAGDAALIGLIRQETLSGIASPGRFEQVRLRLADISDLPLTDETFVLAAEFFNICRSRGTAAGSIDMTICAAASYHNVPIFSVDPDFLLYRKCLPIALHLAN